MTTAIIDTFAAEELLSRILGNEPGESPTIVPAQAPAQPVTRKKRSDAGQPKKLPADPDEITLKLTLAEARNAAICCGKYDCYGIAEHIQDQIISCLQKRLDQLSKQK